MPAYTVPGSAHYPGLPVSTVRYWSAGRDSYKALITAAEKHPVILSFLNLVELHLLAAIRREHDVSMPNVRRAIDYLKKSYNTNHPLLAKELETDGLDIFIRHYRQLITISKDGQTAMRHVMEAALKRIERDNNIPVKLYPFTRAHIENAPALIMIDPAISGGRPVIAGTGLATEIIAERLKAGESIHELAYDYGRTEAEIEEAIRCEQQAA
ncbi:MAG: DUF433 domain-containing protein [Gammaproteobacteria bacterium]